MNDNLLLQLRELSEAAMSRTERKYDSHETQLSAIRESLAKIRRVVDLEIWWKSGKNHD
jgi:hypothetical protein